MRLELVRDEAGFAALRPVWDGLLEQSATCTPFLRWDWVWLWWEEFGSGFELAIAVLRDDDSTVVAIAPLMTGLETEGLRKHLRHLGFLAGLGEAKGERMDFLVPAGREAELTPLLCGVFRLLSGKYETVWLNKLPEESPNRRHVMEALEECAVATDVVVRTKCDCIQMEGTTEELEARISPNLLRKMRKRGERLRREHEVHECLVTAEDVAARLEEFADLHRQRYPEGVSSFMTARSWRFHRRLALLWLGSGRAMLPFITVDRRMVGGIYGFVERDEFFFFQMGWNTDYRRFSMGHLSLRWAAECCRAKDLRVMDLLPGTHRYKKEWAQTCRYVLDIEAYEPKSVRAGVFRSVRGLKRLVKRPTQAMISP